jgi:hypothetical protein
VAKSSFTKHLSIIHHRDAEIAETPQRGRGGRPSDTFSVLPQRSLRLRGERWRNIGSDICEKHCGYLHSKITQLKVTLLDIKISGDKVFKTISTPTEIGNLVSFANEQVLAKSGQIIIGTLVFLPRFVR